MNLKNKQGGFSLLGIMAALVILAFLIAAFYRYQKFASEASRASELVRVVRALKQEVVSIRGVETVIGIYEYLEATGAAPKGFEPVPGVRRWKTKWGEVYVGGLGTGPGYLPPGYSATDAIQFYFPEVSNDICLEVVQSLEAEFDLITFNPGNGETIIKNYNVPFVNTDAAVVCHTGNNIKNGRLRVAIYR